VVEAVDSHGPIVGAIPVLFAGGRIRRHGTLAACSARPTELATGQAGDVIVCHPFLVHAASWPHTGRHPRIMAQPGVAMHDAFPLVPSLSPVELAMWPG
jgi:hypothetical protein